MSWSNVGIGAQLLEHSMAIVASPPVDFVAAVAPELCGYED